MRIGAGVVSYTGGRRRQGKVSMGSVHSDWSYKSDRRRATTVRVIDHQYVRTSDSSAITCQVRVKRDSFGIDYYLAYVTNKYFDSEQGCSITRVTGEYFKVQKLVDVEDFWEEIVSNNKNKSKVSKNRVDSLKFW